MGVAPQDPRVLAMSAGRGRTALIVGLVAVVVLGVAATLVILNSPERLPAFYPIDPAHPIPDPVIDGKSPSRPPRSTRLPAREPVPADPDRTAGRDPALPMLPPGAPRLEDHLNPVAAPTRDPATVQARPASPASSPAHSPDGSPEPAVRPGSDPDVAAALADPGDPNRWTTLADRFRVQRLHDLEAAALRRALRAARDPGLAEALKQRVRQAEDDARSAGTRSGPIEFPAPSVP